MIKPIYIRVTSVGECQRPAYYSLRGEKRLTDHFYSKKGQITHTLIESELSGATGDLTTLVEEEMLDVPNHGKDELRKFSSDLHDQFHIWKATTDLVHSGEDIIIEERLTKEVHPGVFLTGKPDLRTDTTIIDFKSGKKANRKQYKQQLGGYQWLVGKPQKLANVFLGEKDPKEVIHDPKEIDEVMPSFWDEFNRAVDERRMSENGIIPPARRGYTCAFCEYNSVCRGFGGVDKEIT